MLELFLNKCDSCGRKSTVHLGKGVYVCAKCGYLTIKGNPDDYDDDEGEGYSWEEIWEERPSECDDCDNDAYPECIKCCSRCSGLFS